MLCLDQGPGARVYDRQYPEDMDSYFVYNYHVIEELKDFKSMFFDHLITPVIHGYLDIQEGCTINSTVFKLILISRRSYLVERRSEGNRYNNIGRRYTTRGLDEDANAANFVETEQILVRRNGEVSSYVQVRVLISSTLCLDPWQHPPQVVPDAYIEIYTQSRNWRGQSIV